MFTHVIVSGLLSQTVTHYDEYIIIIILLSQCHTANKVIGIRLFVCVIVVTCPRRPLCTIIIMYIVYMTYGTTHCTVVRML